MNTDIDKSPDFDVIIAGGGPAGAAAAYYFHFFDRQGLLNILLIEKKCFEDEYERYHHKCGECVSKYFLDIIKPIQVKGEEIVAKVKKTREYWGREPACVSPTDEYILNRPLFLKSVLRAAEGNGVMVRFDEVIKVINNDSGATVTCKSGFTAFARMIIGADGPNSRIRNTCGFDKPQILTAMQYLVPADATSEPDEIVIWYDEKYKGGYKYLFSYGEDARKLGFIHSTDIYQGPVLELQAKQIAMGGLKNYAKDHVILIGDAAGQANLLTGGGILPAFIAARELSRSIVNATKHLKKLQRTKAFIMATKKFEKWWKHSPYESRRYISAYNQFAKFSNGDLEKFSLPFRCIGRLHRVYNLLKNICYWHLYFTMQRAIKYS